MKRALVLCPGRGSYARDTLGSVKGLNSPSLDVFDAHRAALGRPTVREMDAKSKFTSKLHIRGENASALTAGVSLADLDQVDEEAYEVVGVVGNSMGWYTALGYAGALPMEAAAELIETGRQEQIDHAVHVMGSLIGNTITHEIGHSLGMSFFQEDLFTNTMRFHNDFDEEGAIMDGGQNRPFEERAEIDGAATPYFNPRNAMYLQTILPLP